MSTNYIEALQEDLRRLDSICREEGVNTGSSVADQARYLAANHTKKYSDLHQNVIDELTGVDVHEYTGLEMRATQSEQKDAEYIAFETRLRG